MTVDNTFETTMIGNYYPLIRDSFAYALGMVSRYEARRFLGWNTVPTDIDGVAQDDVQRMAHFFCDTFGLEFEELAQLNGRPFRHYAHVFVQALKRHGIGPEQACAVMRQTLPTDWSYDTAE